MYIELSLKNQENKVFTVQSILWSYKVFSITYRRLDAQKFWWTKITKYFKIERYFLEKPYFHGENPQPLQFAKYSPCPSISRKNSQLIEFIHKWNSVGKSEQVWIVLQTIKVYFLQNTYDVSIT